MPESVQRFRNPLRLKNYDYSLEGAYFITLVTHGRVALFGSVMKGAMILNQAGRIAFDQWTRLDKRFPQSDFSTFVVMPNHVHGIIFVNSRVAIRTLGVIVRAYKAAVTFRINSIRGMTDPPVWQSNYYEKIINNETELENIWKYIDTNPEKWAEDRMNYSTPTKGN